MKEHIIALVDCDSFFVSCEQAVEPSLRGQPVCVVTGDNGCVVSRSREAKKAGVKMGMPMFMARREFPSVIYKNARHELYCRYSRRVMTCLREIVPDVEEVSVDEAYADLTSIIRRWPPASGKQSAGRRTFRFRSGWGRPNCWPSWPATRPRTPAAFFAFFPIR